MLTTIQAYGSSCDVNQIIYEKLINATANLNEYQTCMQLKSLKNNIILAVNLPLFAIGLAFLFCLTRRMHVLHVVMIVFVGYMELIFLAGIPNYE